MPKADKPWERQKGESEKAYEAFSTYRDMGEKRTFAAVAEKLQKSDSLIRRWGKRWIWEDRARAYDNDLEREAMKKAIADRRAMTERHINISMRLQQKAMQALKTMKPETMTPKDVVAMVDAAARLERLSRGEATERTEGRQTVEADVSFRKIDLSNVSDEELAMLDEITGKIFAE